MTMTMVNFIWNSFCELEFVGTRLDKYIKGAIKGQAAGVGVKSVDVQ